MQEKTVAYLEQYLSILKHLERTTADKLRLHRDEVIKAETELSELDEMIRQTESSIALLRAA